MKKLKTVISLFLVAIMFTGCSMRISSSIDDMISPISPFGDNADIKNAMDEFLTKGYSIKTPSIGEYITAYNLFDIDGDGDEEAIAFYEPNDNLGRTDMALLKKVDDKWTVIESVAGEGAEVSSLDFSDLNGDDRSEMIVCWDKIRHSTNHELAIYKYNAKAKTKHMRRTYNGISVNNYIPVDITGDGVDDLLMFELISGSRTYAKAELYSFAEDTPILRGETKLDGHINSYTELKVETVDGNKRVYADAICTNGSSMLTEIIYWADRYNTIISPFYSYSTGLSSGTTRNALLSSRDVNGDGRFEIPRDKKLKKMPKSVSCMDWGVYKNSILIHTDYTLSPVNDGYLVVIPDKYIYDIKVKYNSKTKQMTILDKSDNTEVCSVKPVLKATYEKDDHLGYVKVMEDAGYYYLAKSGDSENVDISIKYLKKNIKSLNNREENI